MTLPNLPDRKPMFDTAGYPTTPTRVWWQAVKREFDGVGTGGGSGTVTSVSGAGTVSGLTLTGTVTTTGNITLGGTLAVTPANFASQTANTFLAAPNGAPGAPTFRAIVAADVPTLNQNTTGSAATLTTSRDFSITGGGITAAAVGFNGSAAVVLNASVDAGHITLARMADIATARFIGRTTAGTGAPEALTGTQATTLLDVFTSSLKGLAPASGGGTANYLRADGTWAAPVGLGASAALEYFGDGSDGDVTISSGTTTITRDMYYNNVTISGTGQLNTAQFRVFIKGTLDISAAPANAIYAGNAGASSRNGGSSATNGAGTNGAGGNLSSSGRLGNGQAGNNGATGGTGAGAQASATTAQTNTPAGASGAGGAGGAVGGTAGGASRAATAQTTPSDIRRLVSELAEWVGTTYSRMNAGSGAPGGSAGAGDGVGSGGGGGGGGAGGGLMYVAASTINRSGSTAASAISAAGGNGGNGGPGQSGTNRGGGGGGAGGGGGWIYLIYQTLTGSTATNCLDATGGNGGNGGAGTGTGGGGNGGGAGAGGRIQVFDLGNATQTITTGGAAVAGGAASGGTGGTGATATANRVNL